MLQGIAFVFSEPEFGDEGETYHKKTAPDICALS